MSVSRRGNAPDKFSGVNWAVLTSQTGADHNNDYDNPIQTEISDPPDGFVLMVHSIRIMVDDIRAVVRDNISEAVVQAWVYNDTVEDPGDWDGRTNHPDFLTHAEVGGGTVGTATDDTAFVPPQDQTDFPLPVLNPDGEFTVIAEGGGTGDGEWVVMVYYDIVEVTSTEEYLEILLQR